MLRPNKGIGASTELEAGEVHQKFKEISKRIEFGYIDIKRQKVLKQMKETGNSDDLWGRGLLLFSSKARVAVNTNLKNRLLPTLEISNRTKIRKGFKATQWTRSCVNEFMHKRANQWLDHAKSLQQKELVCPYAIELAECILAHPREDVLVLPRIW